MAIDASVGVFLQPFNATANAAANNVATLVAVRAFLEHATGADLLALLLASQVTKVRS